MSDSIEYLSLDETRAAAQQLLDNTDGDLIGADAERFSALTEHAEQLRKQQRQRAEAGREYARRVKAGEATIDRGSEAYTHTDDDKPPAVRQRDTAMRVLDRTVKDGTLQARGAETVERLMQDRASASAVMDCEMDYQHRRRQLSVGVQQEAGRSRKRSIDLDRTGSLGVAQRRSRAGRTCNVHHRLGRWIFDPASVRSVHPAQ